MCFSSKNHIVSITKIRFVLFMSLSIPVICYFIFKFNLGDRLFSQKLLDDSALVRISSLTLFLNTDFLSILFGLSEEKIELLMYKAQILIIENFWINYFLRYGLIGFILFNNWVLHVVKTNI